MLGKLMANIVITDLGIICYLTSESIFNEKDSRDARWYDGMVIFAGKQMNDNMPNLLNICLYNIVPRSSQGS